jgi:hypothetical protein
MYHLKAGNSSFEAEIKQGVVILNGKEMTPSAYTLPNSDTHLLLGTKGYRVENLGWNETHDVLTLRVNGKVIAVEAKTELSILLQKMGIHYLFKILFQLIHLFLILKKLKLLEN